MGADLAEDAERARDLFMAVWEDNIAPPVNPGSVDDGPDPRAIAFAAGIVLMAIAMGILLGSIVAGGWK